MKINEVDSNKDWLINMLLVMLLTLVVCGLALSYLRLMLYIALP